MQTALRGGTVYIDCAYLNEPDATLLFVGINRGGTVHNVRHLGLAGQVKYSILW
jgi:hypothetical protein